MREKEQHVAPKFKDAVVTLTLHIRVEDLDNPHEVVARFRETLSKQQPTQLLSLKYLQIVPCDQPK